MNRALPLFALLGLSCAGHPARVATPGWPTASAAPFEAAVASADITPPPGVSTFGHGPDALVAEGYWTRIACRAFVLRQGSEVIAVVPCDLPASSTLLQHAIADRVVGLVPVTRIFLSTTHTHAGPAHYLDEDALGGPDSTQMPGFDPKMVEFLSIRIANSIQQAFRALAPAELRVEHFEEGDACPDGRCGLWGISWNRSLLAHERGAPDPEAPGGLAGVNAAIDSSLHWMEFRWSATHAPMGGLAFYALHPTVLPNTNRRIGADVDGIVSRLLERRLLGDAQGQRDAPVGVINTNEGDMSPIWTEGSKQEAIAVAEKIVDRLVRLRDRPAHWEARIALDARYAEVDLADQLVSDGSRTCARAELGESGAFGACDHPTSDKTGPPLPLPPADGCQAPKLTPLGELEWLAAGGQRSFPTHVPLALLRLDDSLVAFVPAEFTIGAGRQLRRRLLAEPPTGVQHAFVGGLTNGYILYVASEAEYRWSGLGGGCALATDSRVRQSYEGASTLYGPKTALFFADRMRALERAMLGESVPGVDEVKPGAYPHGPIRSRLSLPTVPPRNARRKARATCTLPSSRAVCFQWTDGPVGDFAYAHAPWIRLRGADALTVEAGLGPIDDRGFDFVTRVSEDRGDQTDWATIFVADAREQDALPRTVSIAVEDEVSGAAISDAFGADLPRVCTLAEVQACGDYNDPVIDKPYATVRLDSSAGNP